VSETAGESRPSALSQLLAADKATRAAASSARRWLNLYRRAAGATLSEPHLDLLLAEALEAIAGMLGADAASLLLANEDGTELIGRAAFGLDKEVDLSVSIPAGAGVSGPVLASGEPRLVRDLTKVDVISQVLLSSGQRSYVGVPLKASGQVLGVLHATRSRVQEFNEEDVELLMRFAEPIAAAIERVRLFEAERSARETAERVTERMRALQRITASLADTESIDEICNIIVYDAVGKSSPGARGAIWLLRDGRLVLIAGLGLSEKYPEIPLDTSLPAAENLKEGVPLFVETRDDLARRWPVLAEGETSSFAGLPLIVEGKRLGIMAVGFREEHLFPAEEREYLSTLAEQAAFALARANARAELHEARDIAEVRREQLAFLADASKRLSRSLDLEETLRTVAELGVPRLTDRSALFLVEGETISKRILAPEMNDDERELLDGTEATLTDPTGIGAVIRTGQPEYFEYIDDAMLVAGAESPDHLALLRRVGFGGSLIMPLRTRGKTLGALAFVNREGRPITEVDRALAEELSARAAVAIDNALRYRDEAYVAHQLADSLLPTGVPDIDGFDVAVRYESGSAGYEVGGDFYDVFELQDGGVIFVVGDVQGKGVEAAALTGLSRYTVRACAQYESTPSALLERLNWAIVRNILDNAESPEHPWNSARLCTAAIVRIDRDGENWTATLSRAGHPAPLLRKREGSVLNLGESALLLGVRDDTRYKDSTVALEPGSTIVLFTDGVSERYGGGGAMFGSDGIARVLGKSEGPAKQITDDIMQAALMHDAPHDDDKVVLTIRIEP